MALTLEKNIKKKLTQEFNPIELEVINESHLHVGHRGSPGTGQSHFKVILKSAVFDDLSRLQRHKCVMDTLKNEMGEGIHALSLTLWGKNE